MLAVSSPQPLAEAGEELLLTLARVAPSQVLEHEIASFLEEVEGEADPLGQLRLHGRHGIAGGRVTKGVNAALDPGGGRTYSRTSIPGVATHGCASSA